MLSQLRGCDPMITTDLPPQSFLDDLLHVGVQNVAVSISQS